LDDLDFVPLSRTITINGTVYDLSANRSWTIATGSATLAGLTDVDITGIAAGKFLSFNGTDWVPQTIDASKWTLTGSDIYRNSNVAIGTSTISGKLHVAGNIHVSGGDINIFNTSNNRLSFGTNNLERVRIDANGVVGIGVNYAYTSAASGNKLLISDSLTPSGTNVDLIRLISGPLDGIATNKYIGINFEGQGLTGGNFGLAAIRAYDISSYRGHLTFWTDPGVQNISLVERYRITHDGKHGFNTSNPTTGFTINELDFLHNIIESDDAFTIYDGANTSKVIRVLSDSYNDITLGEQKDYRVGIGILSSNILDDFHVDYATTISKRFLLSSAYATSNYRVYDDVSPHSLTSDDYVFIYNDTSALTLNLPSIASLTDGFRYTILRYSASGAITVTPNGTDTINSAASYSLSGAGHLSVSVMATTVGASKDWIVTSKF
jgi:hypothetical protein